MGRKWKGGRQFDLFVKGFGSESIRQVTSKPGDWLVPAWSPDGQTIAFARMSESDSGIYSVPALGGPERKLAEAKFDFGPPMSLSWSPDNQQLAYAASDGAYLLSFQNGTRTAIQKPSECIGMYAPTFAPDGRSLLFSCNVAGWRIKIFIRPIAGGDTRWLTTISNQIPTPMACSADSKRIIFSAGTLWEMDVDRPSPRRLDFADGSAQPAISASANRLAFAITHDNANIWGFNVSSRQKTPPKVLVSSTKLQQDPSVSPDGKKILFESNRGGPSEWNEIWVSDFDGRNAVQLTNFRSTSGSARWSPDGKHVAFDSRESGRAAIYVLDAEERIARKIMTHLPACEPTWSRNGSGCILTPATRKMQHCIKFPGTAEKK